MGLLRPDASGARLLRRLGNQQTSLFGGEELFPFGANVAESRTILRRLRSPPRRKWEAKYHLVNTPALFDAFLDKLKTQRFAVDLETTGLEPLRCDIVGLAFCWKEAEAWYLRCAARRTSRCSTRACWPGFASRCWKHTAVKSKSKYQIRPVWYCISRVVSLAGIAGRPDGRRITSCMRRKRS